MGLFNKLLKKKKDLEKDALDTKEKKTGEKKEVKKEVVESGKKVETKRKRKALGIDNVATDILIQPLVTEKSAHAESMNKYSFVVKRTCNKIQIKKAILDIYGVAPTKVAVSNFQGKKIRFKRFLGKRQDFKKAIVSLPKGKSIDIHKGV